MEWTDRLQVFCADVGSIARDRFAWARRIPSTDDEEVHRPESIESLASSVVAVLRRGEPVALGFEAPMFVPVPEATALLGKARPCDAPSPSWSSNVGASVLATAMVQVPWILRYIHESVSDLAVHVRWPPFAEQRGGLLLWEAFVSGAAKGETHEDDARIGVQAFCDQLPNPGDDTAEQTERPFSLLGAAAIWAGFDLAPTETRGACLLVRASPPPDRVEPRRAT
jgi:hypothetical protein